MKNICDPLPIPIKTSADEKLFINTIYDIQEKYVSGNDYKIIKATGLLRLLSLDSCSLIDTVNKSYGVDIRFLVTDNDANPFPFGEIGGSFVMILNPDVSVASGRQNVILNHQEYLRHVCHIKNNIRATVKDVIKACANAKGGVHLDKNERKNISEQIVLDIDTTMTIGNQDPSVYIARGICNSYLVALKPLVEAVFDKHASAIINKK